MLTRWVSPDLTLQLTSEQFVSPMAIIATRSWASRWPQVPSFPFPLHTWSQVMRSCLCLTQPLAWNS